MPKLHEYAPSNEKDGFYIYAMHNGQNVTYQVTSIARQIFERLGYTDETEITGEMLYTLHRLQLICTNKSGVEPPSDLMELTDEIEEPDSPKGDRKRFFSILLEQSDFDDDEREDLSEYLKDQDIEPELATEQSATSTGKGWRSTTPDGGEVYRGTVDFFNDTGGYGFINSPLLDEDVFYHMEDIGGRDVQEGTKVEFAWENAVKGPRSTHIRLINDSEPTDQTRTLSTTPLDDRPPLDEFQAAKMYDAKLEVSFLGTGGDRATEQRATSAIFVDRGSDSFLFDVGENAQRQMDKYGTGFSLDAIFLTSVEPDHIGGLGPLLHTFSVQHRTDELEIYVPAIGVETIELLITLFGEFEYPINILSVEEEAVYDGGSYTINAFNVGTGGERKGYVFDEARRRGRFDRGRAEELGVSPGPDFTHLCNGKSVMIEGDEEIDPRKVVGDPSPGRQFVYTGDVSDTAEIPAAAEDADLLIHEAAYLHKVSEQTGIQHHATGEIAGKSAQQAGVNQLVLTNIAPRTEGETNQLMREVESEFNGDVKLAQDGKKLSLSVPKSNDPPAKRPAPKASSKSGSKRSPSKAKEGSKSKKRTTTGSNPFKNNNSILRDLVRRKH